MNNQTLHELNEASHFSSEYYDSLIADYDEAIRLDPENAKIYIGRGISYRHKGDYDRAIVDFNEAIRVDPEYAIAYGYRGFTYEEKR